MSFFAKNSKGFTLVELLIVIAIIGVLSSVVLSGLSGARSKARDSKRISNIREIQKALEMYYADNGEYPETSWLHSYNASWNTLGSMLSPYMSSLPVDPINQSGTAYDGYHTYSYYGANSLTYGSPVSQWYMIVFKLENQNLKLEQTAWSCSANAWNYGGNDGYIITWGPGCAF